MLAVAYRIPLSQTNLEDLPLWSIILVALLAFGVLGALFSDSGGDGQQSGGAQEGNPPHGGGGLDADQAAVDAVVRAMEGITEGDRLARLRGIYPQLPARLPADRIPGLLQGISGSRRLDAIRVLSRKFPPNMPSELAPLIADPALMTARDRNTALALIYPNQGN